ncbi:MAG: ABC transporter permease [Actinomycetota bacterium]
MAETPPIEAGRSQNEKRPITGETSGVRVVASSVTLRQRFQDLMRYRELLGALVRSEIKVKYKNSALGIAWTMVAPAVQLAIFGVVFGIFLSNGIPDYLIYIASGLLVWTFFSTSLIGGTGVIVGRAGIVKKVSFPREILSIATVGSQAFYLLLQWSVLALFMILMRHAPDWTALPLVIAGFATTLLYAVALAVLLSAVNVYFRDTQHLVEIFVQIWFWMTPIVYTYQHNIHERAVGKWFEFVNWLYLCNPMTPVILAFERAIYGRVTVTNTLSHQPFDVLPRWPLLTYYELLAATFGIGLLLLAFAVRVFSRLEGNFAEEL